MLKKAWFLFNYQVWLTRMIIWGGLDRHVAQELIEDSSSPEFLNKFFRQ